MAESLVYELDGCRAITVKTGGKIHFRLRNYKQFNAKYPGLVNALPELPRAQVSQKPAA
jgi:hypothetical protein